MPRKLTTKAITDDAITADKIVAGAVTADIGNLAITHAHLHTDMDLSSKNVTLPSLANLTVTGDLTVDTNTLKIDSTNNRVGIGTATPTQMLDVTGGNVRLQSSGEAGPHTYRDGDNGNDLRFYSTGGTFASPTAKGSGTAIGNTHYHSYDGSQYRIAASILAKSDGPASTNVTPGRLEFYTTAGASGASGTERIRIHESGHTEVKNGYLSAPYVVGSNWTDNSVYGFKSYNNQSVGVSFGSGSTAFNVATMQITIPATTGVTHWNVIVRGSWTGAQPGHRLWGAIALDSSNNNSYTNNTSSEPTSGWHESSWYESDLSVAAYSWITSSAYTNVTAGTYYVKLGAWASTSGGTCWRSGVNAIWFPSN